MLTTSITISKASVVSDHNSMWKNEGEYLRNTFKTLVFSQRRNFGKYPGKVK